MGASTIGNSGTSARVLSATASADDGASLAIIFAAATALHRDGNLDGAEAAYKSILDSHPKNADALQLLGAVEQQRGNSDAAVRLIEKAIEIDPTNIGSHQNLGLALKSLGRIEDAERRFRAALKLDPGNFQTLSRLGNLLRDSGRRAEAIEFFETALKKNPDQVGLLKTLGNLYLEDSRFGESIDRFRRYLESAPEDFQAVNNLAFAFGKAGDSDAAEKYYRRAYEINPNSAEVCANIAQVLLDRGNVEEAQDFLTKAASFGADFWDDEANRGGALVNFGFGEKGVEIFEKLIAERPADADLHNSHGLALQALGRVDQAAVAYAKAIEIDPDHTAALNSLGGVLILLKNPEQGVDLLKKVIEINPRHLAAHINLCRAYKDLNRYDDAFIYARAALLLDGYSAELTPGPFGILRATCDFDTIVTMGDRWENFDKVATARLPACFLDMLTMAQSPSDLDKLMALHRKWGHDTEARALKNPLPAKPKTRRPGKPRIGILSSDLRQHAVTKFLLPLFRNYDSDSIEISCYSLTPLADDAVQREIIDLVDEFTPVPNMSDHDVAATIREDGIDILLELNGFTFGGRLSALSYRPAPVQVAYLGYPFSTGLPNTDYLLADPYFRPEKPEYLVERTLDMDQSFICFGDFEPVPICQELPVERNGFITFGTLNNPYKFTAEMVANWAKAMQAVPDSRFLFVRRMYASVSLRSNLAAEFAKHGIDAERLRFIANPGGMDSHFDYYNEIDLSLDTYPVTGGTTTVDALWMGVPVVSLVGPATHQRISYTILKNAGLEELCTFDGPSFVEKSIDLANDLESLKFLRQNLRPALLDSPLCDGAAWAKNFQTLMHEVAARHGLT